MALALNLRKMPARQNVPAAPLTGVQQLRLDLLSQIEVLAERVRRLETRCEELESRAQLVTRMDELERRVEIIFLDWARARRIEMERYGEI